VIFIFFHNFFIFNKKNNSFGGRVRTYSFLDANLVAKNLKKAFASPHPLGTSRAALLPLLFSVEKCLPKLNGPFGFINYSTTPQELFNL
jgi:hypothetical protein